jgi:hypothetical protein
MKDSSYTLNTLESIMKRIYPPLNSDPLFFTFPLKFVLDILWLPQSPIDIQYAQEDLTTISPSIIQKIFSQEALY